MDWAKSVSSEPDNFKRLSQFGQCEMMHLTPLHQDLNDQNEGTYIFQDNDISLIFIN